MTFADISFPIPFSAIRTMAGLPVGYEMTNEAYTESFFLVERHSRGIYIKQPNDVYNPYRMLYSAENGFAKASVAWHPVDINLDTIYNYETKQKEYVETQSFFDKEYQCQTAYNWLYYGTNSPLYARLTTMLVKYYWE